MPLLKFFCEECSFVFEELTTAEKGAPCPQCGSENTLRHYQGKCYFGGSGSKGNDGNCSSGSCSSCSGCAS